MPATLPQRLLLPQMQQQWAAQLNPLLSNTVINGQLLTGIALNNGVTVINHGLGRKLQGWFLVGINGAATIYDNQDPNPSPQLTLSLTSSASVIVSLWVF